MLWFIVNSFFFVLIVLIVLIVLSHRPQLSSGMTLETSVPAHTEKETLVYKSTSQNPRERG